MTATKRSERALSSHLVAPAAGISDAFTEARFIDLVLDFADQRCILRSGMGDADASGRSEVKEKCA